MARKLKTYQTSLGFYDLAVAAPSMKAALEAWGSGTNLFQLGAAREIHDTSVVAATMAKPGVVLRRPVGSKGSYSEHAKLPKHLPIDDFDKKAPNRQSKTKEPPIRKAENEKAARDAARAFEREQTQRETLRRKEESTRDRERKRREQAIAKAEAALEAAWRDHEIKVKGIEVARAAEDTRWEKLKDKLEAALRRARD